MAVARGSQRRLSAPIEARRRAPVPAKNSTDREERLIPWDVDGLKELLNGCRLHDVTGFFVPVEMRENSLEEDRSCQMSVKGTEAISARRILCSAAWASVGAQAGRMPGARPSMAGVPPNMWRRRGGMPWLARIFPTGQAKRAVKKKFLRVAWPPIQVPCPRAVQPVGFQRFVNDPCTSNFCMFGSSSPCFGAYSSYTTAAT